MARKVSTGSGKAGAGERPAADEAGEKQRRERMRKLGDQAAGVVRQAADVLEREVAAAADGARRAERRLREEGRLDAEDLAPVIERFRTDGHSLLDVASDRLEDLRADDTQELLQRFAADAHRIFDTVVDLAELAPRLADRLRTDRGAGNGGADGGKSGGGGGSRGGKPTGGAGGVRPSRGAAGTAAGGGPRGGGRTGKS